jgi:polysaccharide pyruvyl transferase WcaK-like protein
VAFRKDLQFSKEFSYQVAQRVITFIATIGVAIWLRSYWALVLGILGGRAIAVAVSYVIHPYRPRFCLSKVSEIWSFSAWMLLVHVAQFLQDKADEFVVGNMTNTETMGNYNVAADAATAPTVELVLPTTRALFPIFSRIANDPKILTEAYLGVFATIAILVCATATGVTLVAADFVGVVLGPRWMNAVPLVEWLAMSGAFYSIMQGAITLISASGHGRLSATLAISRTAVTIPALIAAGWLGSVETIAATRTVVTFLFIPGVFFALARILPLRISDLLHRLWRPVLAAAVMAAMVELCHPLFPDLPPLRLFLDAGLGAMTFAATLLVLWRIAGRPGGPEQAIVAAVIRPFAAKPSLPEADVSSSGVRIFVVSTFSSRTECLPINRGAVGWLRNRGRRLFDHIAWRLGLGWSFHYSVYQDQRDSNRGDSAIRRASVQLLAEAFAHDVQITEFGWDQIDECFALAANRSADLVVIAGGGYFSSDADGNLPNRTILHLRAFERISCPIVGFGLGLNCLLSHQRDHPRLTTISAAILKRFVDGMTLCSARDDVTRAALTFGSVPPVLIPDPALLLDSKAVVLPQRHPPDGLWVGINLAFHGRASTALLARIFPIVVEALGALKQRYPCRFFYFIHSDAERLIPRLLARADIDSTVIDGPPEEMLSWYSLLDVHLCEMLHSAILAANVGVPALNLAYDVKNRAFYELMGLSDVLPAATATAEEILLRLVRMVDERGVRRQAILRRDVELRHDMDVFLARVVALIREPTDKPERMVILGVAEEPV